MVTLSVREALDRAAPARDLRELARLVALIAIEEVADAALIVRRECDGSLAVGADQRDNDLRIEPISLCMCIRPTNRAAHNAATGDCRTEHQNVAWVAIVNEIV